MNLDNIRKKINKIDTNIISFLAQRQSLMPAVGKYKRQNNLTIHQPKREREILAKLLKIAGKKKLNPQLIRKVFKEIMKDSKRIQKKS